MSFSFALSLFSKHLTLDILNLILYASIGEKDSVVQVRLK